MTSLQHYWHHYSVESNCTYHRFGNFRNIFTATPRTSRLSVIQSSWHIKLTIKAFIEAISRGGRVEKFFEHTKLLSWTHQNHNCAQPPRMKKAGSLQKRPTTEEGTTVRRARAVDRWRSQIPTPRRVTHTQRFSHRSEGSGSLLGVPSPRVLYQEDEPPEHVALKVSRALFLEPLGAGGYSSFTLKGVHTASHTPEHRAQVPGPHLTAGLGGSLGVARRRAHPDRSHTWELLPLRETDAASSSLGPFPRSKRLLISWL